MNHQEVRRRLGEYLDGDIALRERALLDAHLDACASCAEELRALRSTIRLLRDLPAPELPAHFAERLVGRIEDGAGRARWWDGLASLWSDIDPARYLPPLAAAALTSAVVIVGVRDLGWQIPGMRAPAPSAPAEVPSAATASRSAAGAPSAGEPRAQIYAFSPAPGRAAAGAEAAPPGPSGLQGPFGASAAPEEPAPPRAPSPEEDLELALVDPRAFVARFRGLGRPEVQDAWIAAVASHAARRRSVADVARRLRETAGPEGHALATRFEGAAQAVVYPAEGR